MVHVLQTTQNFVISRCCFAEDGKEFTRNYNTRALPLFCSLYLFFSDVPVVIVVVVFLNSLSTANRVNFNSKQRNSGSRDGVCQLLPHVPRRTLVHVRRSCTSSQGSHRIPRAINRDTLYQTSLLIGRYVAQKNNENL